MYLFFDNVPSNPTAEILKLKLQSPSYPGAARCNARFGELKPGLRSLEGTPYSPYVYCILLAVPEAGFYSPVAGSWSTAAGARFDTPGRIISTVCPGSSDPPEKIF